MKPNLSGIEEVSSYFGLNVDSFLDHPSGDLIIRPYVPSIKFKNVISNRVLVEKLVESMKGKLESSQFVLDIRADAAKREADLLSIISELEKYKNYVDVCKEIKGA